ncbi:MAG: protein-disulfide reductase DsbD domain-containing protein [Myxococcota bacterium]
MAFRRHALLPVLLVILACPREPASPPSPSDAAPTLVDAQPVSDTAEITPGARFHVGVRFRIAPGWHIYWKNPGDSGLATRITLDAPPGFTVGEALYPGPTRFTSPGNLVSYGYHDETMVLLPVQAPTPLPAAPSLQITARWLVCKESCIPGKATWPLSFPRPSDANAIAPYLARMPQPLPPDVRWQWEGMTLLLTLPNVSDAELFPNPPEGVEYAGHAVTPDDALAAHFTRAGTTPLQGGQGVLRLKDRYFNVQVPWPQGVP